VVGVAFWARVVPAERMSASTEEVRARVFMGISK
jgi:hypothetical protein